MCIVTCTKLPVCSNGAKDLQDYINEAVGVMHQLRLNKYVCSSLHAHPVLQGGEPLSSQMYYIQHNKPTVCLKKIEPRKNIMESVLLSVHQIIFSTLYGNCLTLMVLFGD